MLASCFRIVSTVLLIFGFFVYTPTFYTADTAWSGSYLPWSGRDLTINSLSLSTDISSAGYFFNNSGTSYITGGDFGIGTASPQNQGPGFQLSGAQPVFIFEETGVAADNTTWDVGIFAEQLRFRLVSDAYDSATNWLTIDRTGNTVDTVAIPSGNVGIGTASPGVKLDVEKSSHGVLAQFSDTVNIVQVEGDATGGRVGTSSNHDLRIKTNDVDRIYIENDGNIGIGTASPQHSLHINAANKHIMFTDSGGTVDTRSWQAYTDGTTNTFLIGTVDDDGTNLGNNFAMLRNGSVGIGDTTPSYRLQVAGGTVAGAGAYVNTSDKRLKKDFQTVAPKSACEKIGQLQPTLFNWRTNFYQSQEQYANSVEYYEKEVDEHGVRRKKTGMVHDTQYKDVNQPSGEKDIGFLAQDVQPVFPQAVYGSEQKGYTIAYTKFIPLMMACIQHQQAQILELLKGQKP